MRIAISTDGEFVSAHFGRCPVFTFLDIEKGEVLKRYEVENPGHQPGFIPQFLKEQGAECVVCGGIGPRAQEFMQEFGIKVIAGISAKIDEIIAPLAAGRLKGGESSCDHGPEHVCDHHHHDSQIEGSGSAANSGLVAITSQGRDLDSPLDHRFGRCPYFLLVEPATCKFEIIENQSADLAEGAGTQAAQIMINHRVEAVLTGNMGPNAFQAMQAAGIAVFTSLSGSVKAAMEQYRQGKLVPGKEANVAGHHGQG